MAKKKLYAHILLDRSGSMEDCRDTAIGAFNEYVNSLRLNDRLAARISLTTFDDQSIDLVFDRRKAETMPALTKEMFVPRGMTPLNDAIGSTAGQMEKVKLERDEGVAFVILTDGLENASREYSRDAVRKLLERLQAEKNWLVVYLGANQDAFAEGATRGVAPGRTINFDVQHMPAAVGAVARMSAAFAESARPASVEFTNEERRAARAK
jgi:Mg-chelatase subunit ChlD